MKRSEMWGILSVSFSELQSTSCLRPGDARRRLSQRPSHARPSTAHKGSYMGQWWGGRVSAGATSHSVYTGKSPADDVPKEQSTNRNGLSSLFSFKDMTKTMEEILLLSCKLIIVVGQAVLSQCQVYSRFTSDSLWMCHELKRNDLMLFLSLIIQQHIAIEIIWDKTRQECSAHTQGLIQSHSLRKGVRSSTVYTCSLRETAQT